MNKRILTSLIVAGAMAIAFGGGLLLATFFGGSNVSIPEDIRSQLNFTPHLPSTLPDKYQVVDSSFTYNEGVLVYKASHGDETLSFTEQAKPKDFDFGAFYQGQMQDAKTLSDMPYSSVWGKSPSNSIMLSVLTDDSWLIMSTDVPLNEDNIKEIAQNIRANE